MDLFHADGAGDRRVSHPDPPVWSPRSIILAADGSFTFNVPDFARDPVVAPYSGYLRGRFRLRVRESATGSIPYTLEDIRNRGRDAEVAIAAEYPQPLQLVVVSR